MTKEELRKEAEEYANNLVFVYETDIVQRIVRERVRLALIDVLESREKQIQINAEQIRALQKQNGELTDELTKKSETNHSLVEQMADLESENAELKEKYVKNITDCDICDTYCNSQLNNAKEIINDCVCELQNILFYKMRNKERIASTLDKAEQFLNSEVENV